MNKCLIFCFLLTQSLVHSQSFKEYSVVYDKTYNYAEAEAKCESLEAYLAIIPSREVHYYLRDAIESLPGANTRPYSFIVGLKRSGRFYKWVDGTRLSYTDWAPHVNPDNQINDCITIGEDGTEKDVDYNWIPTQCDTMRSKVLCERKSGCADASIPHSKLASSKSLFLRSRNIRKCYGLPDIEKGSRDSTCYSAEVKEFIGETYSECRCNAASFSSLNVTYSCDRADMFLNSGVFYNCFDGTWFSQMIIIKNLCYHDSSCMTSLRGTYDYVFRATSQHIVGMTSKFGCDTGYINHGARNAMCSKTAQWTVSDTEVFPYCLKAPRRKFKEYKVFYEQTADYDEAVEICAGVQAHLVTMSTSEEHRYVNEIINSLPVAVRNTRPFSFLTGLKWNGSEYLWEDGTNTLIYNNWGYGSITDNEGMDCMTLSEANERDPDYMWYPSYCSTKNKVICQRNSGCEGFSVNHANLTMPPSYLIRSRVLEKCDGIPHPLRGNQGSTCTTTDVRDFIINRYRKCDCQSKPNINDTTIYTCNSVEIFQSTMFFSKCTTGEWNAIKIVADLPCYIDSACDSTMAGSYTFSFHAVGQYAAGERAPVQCNKDYVNEGAPEAICLYEGEWGTVGSQSLPKCSEGCTEAPPTTNVSYIIENQNKAYAVGISFEYGCTEDINLRFSSTCLGDRTWSFKVSDQMRDCPLYGCNEEPVPTSEAEISGEKPGNYKIGETIQYTCTLKRDTVITSTCQPSHSWSVTQEFIKSLCPGCLNPPNITDGRITVINEKNLYKIGEKVHYVCKGKDVEPLQSECTESHAWSVTKNQVMEFCPEPPTTVVNDYDDGGETGTAEKSSQKAASIIPYIAAGIAVPVAFVWAAMYYTKVQGAKKLQQMMQANDMTRLTDADETAPSGGTSGATNAANAV